MGRCNSTEVSGFIRLTNSRKHRPTNMFRIYPKLGNGAGAVFGANKLILAPNIVTATYAVAGGVTGASTGAGVGSGLAAIAAWVAVTRAPRLSETA